MPIPEPLPGYLCRAYAEVALNGGSFLSGDQAEIVFEWFEIKARTDKGVWIVDHTYRSRWVQDGRGKRYAYADPALALESLRQRLKWRKIYHNREARRIAAIEKELSNV